METTINGVTITLTEDQIDHINKQLDSKKSIFDRVKSYEDACKVLGKSVNPDAFFYEKIKIIAKALNEGVKIDFTNSNQPKWYPWFKCNSSGAWSLAGCYFGASHSFFPVAYVTSEEKAKYLGTQFIDLYKEILNNY